MEHEAPGAAPPMPPQPGPSVTVSVGLPIGGRPFRAQLSVPAGNCHPTTLLPLFFRLADTFVQSAIDEAAAGGQGVSCTQGCTACCHHLVPVSEVEVSRLAERFAAMDAPDRAAVRRRLDAAGRMLRDSPLQQRLDRLDELWDDALVALIRDYFRLGIPCPFLQHGACMVYADRPAACREHLVTSAAALCADPGEAGVALLPIPKEAVSRALRCFNADPAYGRKGWRPLVTVLRDALARECGMGEAGRKDDGKEDRQADRHDDSNIHGTDRPQAAGPALLQRFFERLADAG